MGTHPHTTFLPTWEPFSTYYSPTRFLELLPSRVSRESVVCHYHCRCGQLENPNSLPVLVNRFSSFGTHLCMSFTHVSINVFAFFLLIFNSSLYIKVIPLCTADNQRDSQTPWGRGRPSQSLSTGCLAPAPPARLGILEFGGRKWLGR